MADGVTLWADRFNCLVCACRYLCAPACARVFICAWFSMGIECVGVCGRAWCVSWCVCAAFSSWCACVKLCCLLRPGPSLLPLRCYPAASGVLSGGCERCEW